MKRKQTKALHVNLRPEMFVTGSQKNKSKVKKQKQIHTRLQSSHELNHFSEQIEEQ